MSTVPEIKRAITSWLSKSMGLASIFKISFDADFVAGNQINGDFNAEAMAEVGFDADQAATMAKLAKAVQATAAVFRCKVTGPRELTCTGARKGYEVAVSNLLVTGGISQPLAAITQVQAPIKVKVIRADQTADQPNKPYAYYRLGVERTIGLRDAIQGFDEDGLFEYAGERILTVSVQVIGDNALQYMRDARAALNLQGVLDEFYNVYGMAFMDAEALQNLTGFLETISEERAAMDFRFSHSESTTEEMGQIGQAEIKGSVGSYTDENIVDLP